MTPGAMVFTLGGLVLGAVVVDEVRRIRLALQAVVALVAITVTPKVPSPAKGGGEGQGQPKTPRPPATFAVKNFDKLDALVGDPKFLLNGVLREVFGEHARQSRGWRRGRFD